MRFLSTLSLRRATRGLLTPRIDRRYFYPRSPCGERPCGNAGINSPITISIHALLAESDEAQDGYKDTVTEFLSTLSLRRATGKVRVVEPGLLFLSTLSLRRATAPNRRPYHYNRNFYPRSPCGERQHTDNGTNANLHFYPRSPCGERPRAEHHASTQQEFLSTLSLRRATLHCKTLKTFRHYFYPRSPCGERHAPNRRLYHCNKNFYPRSPCGERLVDLVSIVTNKDFYPRSPCGERPTKHGQATSNQPISIHALLAESDTRHGSCRRRLSISIHALLAESDRPKRYPAPACMYFYPRSPCGERPPG